MRPQVASCQLPDNDWNLQRLFVHSSLEGVMDVLELSMDVSEKLFHSADGRLMFPDWYRTLLSYSD